MILVLLSAWALASGTAGDGPEAKPDPFRSVRLPEAWERQFWESPEAQALLALEPAALAKLVPTQAGLHACGCPACGAADTEDVLGWSIEHPEVVTCRRCGQAFPNEKFPAKVAPAPGQPPVIPEEVIEVRPGVWHRYPYHLPDAAHQRYPDERFYLAARRDDQARRFLSRAALYLAARARDDADPRFGIRAAVLLLRFAQVYPSYATHLDSPGRPKALQPADLRPPYRSSYGTAKWDTTGALEVPLNLVLAYSLIRHSPALAEAGKLLDDDHPARTIEHDLLRASARFAADQPDDPTEGALYVIRGLLAVGRLLDDPRLLREGSKRFDSLLRRGFHYDGVWRDPRGSSQQRVVRMLDAWIDPWLPAAESGPSRELLALARSVPRPLPTTDTEENVLLAAWPAPEIAPPPHGPLLLGGAGLARMAVGDGPGRLEIELRGAGDDGGRPSARLALRAAVGGRLILGDLDDLPGRSDGLDRATASHNTAIIDGLNQRESLQRAIRPELGANIGFFAADPDFQITALDDPRAYPLSAELYRRIVVASTGPAGTYAVDLAEVRGGLQHDQLFLAAPGVNGRWQLPGPLRPGPETLLAPTIVYLPRTRADDGRWFVQALGSLTDLAHLSTASPVAATLKGDQGSLRLHLMNAAPAVVVVGTAPAAADARRAALVVRQRSQTGETLHTRMLSVLEPLTGPGLRIGRVESPPETAVLVVEGNGGVEHLVLNTTPGESRSVSLADGRILTTDGLAVRVREDGLALAGGSFARVDTREVRREAITGTIRLAVPDDQGRGVFATDARCPDTAALSGRTLIIQHGDGTARAWTIAAVEALEDGTRFHVRESPGFQLDRHTDEARYDHFPGATHPGPHRFRVATIAR